MIEEASRYRVDMVRTRAKALGAAGWLAMFQGDYREAKPLLEKGLALYRELGDKDGIASCLITLGFVATLGQRDLASIPALFEEAMSLKPELTDARVVANLLIFAGLVAASGGDFERSMRLHEEALVHCRETRDMQGMGICLTNWGLMEMTRANYAKAREILRENLQLAYEPDNKVAIHWSFVGLAGVALGQGNPARAARLWGMAEAMREAFGIFFSPLARDHTRYEDLLADARSQLGETNFEEAWAEGKATNQARAIEYALAEEESSSGPEKAPSGEKEDTLSPREQEVAALVARGLTNRRIASELSISERTAATHVGRILKKLGLRSRDEVAPVLERRR